MNGAPTMYMHIAQSAMILMHCNAIRCHALSQTHTHTRTHICIRIKMSNATSSFLHLLLLLATAALIYYDIFYLRWSSSSTSSSSLIHSSRSFASSFFPITLKFLDMLWKMIRIIIKEHLLGFACLQVRLLVFSVSVFWACHKEATTIKTCRIVGISGGFFFSFRSFFSNNFFFRLTSILDIIYLR